MSAARLNALLVKRTKSMSPLSLDEIQELVDLLLAEMKKSTPNKETPDGPGSRIPKP